jgi:Mce-associated membrane protein
MSEHGRHRRQEAVGRARKVPDALIVVLTVLCVAVAALDVVLLLRLHDRQSRNDATAATAASVDAVATAKTAVTEILSYDYRTLDKDIATAKNAATGDFLREYSSTASRLLSQAKQLKAVVQASVASMSVVSASETRVVVLGFVDQATIKAGDKQTRIDQNRVRLTMQKVEGRWLVAGLDAL